MHIHQCIPVRVSKGIVAIALVFSGAWIAFINGDGGFHVAAAEQGKIVSTIFAYDGQDFVRTHTTLITEAGEPAINTKLDNGSPAYKALTQKRSYRGPVSLFGRKYDAQYAPLTGGDGQLTGALFVGVAMAMPDVQQSTAEPHYSGPFTGEEPAFYDRGLDLVVVFYYVNAQGKRVVVTTVAPKDPDSGRLATEHIVTLDQGESFHATFATDDPTVKPVHVMLKTTESTVRPGANH